MDGSCDEGLVCSDLLCAPGSVTGVSFPAGARACEVLVEEMAGALGDVRFATGIDGTFVREAPQVAITVMQQVDEDFPAGAVEVVATADASLEVRSSSCVDTAGAPMPGAGVVFQ